MVLGVGVVVEGSVPTVVGADDVGLTVVGGGGVVVVVVGTSMAGTVTMAMKTDVEVVVASEVAGGSTGAAVVRVVGTRTIGVALAAVAAGTMSALVVVALVVVVVVAVVVSAVTVVPNTTTFGAGAVVTAMVNGVAVGSAATRVREWVVGRAAKSARTMSAMMIAGCRQIGRVLDATAMARWFVQP
jgi:hypothetical protein